MKYQRIPEKVNVERFDYGWNLEDGHGCTKHGTICGQRDLTIEEGAELKDIDCFNCVRTRVFCSQPFVWLKWREKRVPLSKGDIIVTNIVTGKQIGRAHV